MVSTIREVNIHGSEARLYSLSVSVYFFFLVLKTNLVFCDKLMLLFYLSWKINTECELDAIDQSGCTPLHHACINAPDGHRSVKVGVSIGH